MYSLGYYVKHPISFVYGCISKIPQLIPAKIYLTIGFKGTFDYRPDLNNPKTFNEKLQRLKLYDHNPKYTMMADKYAAKNFIKSVVGEEYVIPLLGVRDKFDDIDFDKLPNQFVLKCNHDGGSVIIVKDKSVFDKKAAKKKLDRALKYNWYNLAKERVYKDIKPKIICEQYLDDGNSDGIKDYKWFCFNGEPKVMYISNDHGKKPHTDFYDMEFNHLDIRMRDPNSKNPPKIKPKSFDEMKELARKLSNGIPHLRVDFYCVDNRIFVGELTFYTNGGFGVFSDKKWDYKFGEYLELPKIKEK